MVTYKVFDEIIDLITSVPKPEQIIKFKTSEQAQFRLEELLFKKREDSLTEEEQRELEQYLTIEHIMRLAKTKAKQKIDLIPLSI